jgi:hypothetical protein
MISPPQAKPAKRQTYRERVLSGNVSRKPRQRIKPVSAPCHRRVHDNPAWAKERGLLVLVTDTNDPSSAIAAENP